MNHELFNSELIESWLIQLPAPCEAEHDT
jgi:hypothetical protein